MTAISHDIDRVCVCLVSSFHGVLCATQTRSVFVNKTERQAAKSPLMAALAQQGLRGNQ